MSDLQIPKVETEDAHGLALATWGQMCDTLVQVFVDKYGMDEALKMLRPYLEKLGEPAPVFAEMMGIEGNDAMAIASIFCLYEGQILKVEGEVTEASPDRVVKRSTNCPFQNLSSGFCWAFTIMAEGMAKAINPDYELKVTQMMTEGDPVCEWVVEKK
jgi:predicted ArsR family transcriptional regulator